MNRYLKNKVVLFKEKLNLSDRANFQLTSLIGDIMFEVATAQNGNPNLNFKGEDCEDENTLKEMSNSDIYNYNKKNTIFDDNMLSKCSNLSEIHVNKDATPQEMFANAKLNNTMFCETKDYTREELQEIFKGTGNKFSKMLEDWRPPKK